MSYADALDRIFLPGRLTLALDRESLRSVDVDGHLRVKASVISAAEVSSYLGAEIPDGGSLGLDRRATYQVFRDPVELEKAVPSFAGKPLLSRHRPLTADDHPFGTVVGSVMNPVWRAPYVVAELIVWDASAIEAIESGECDSLSAGYRYQAIPGNGYFNGKPWTLRMVSIACNHVALCPSGRISAAVVGDARRVRRVRAAA
jgi:hypothetical protein